MQNLLHGVRTKCAVALKVVGDSLKGKNKNKLNLRGIYIDVCVDKITAAPIYER